MVKWWEKYEKNGTSRMIWWSKHVETREFVVIQWWDKLDVLQENHRDLMVKMRKIGQFRGKSRMIWWSKLVKTREFKLWSNGFKDQLFNESRKFLGSKTGKNWMMGKIQENNRYSMVKSNRFWFRLSLKPIHGEKFSHLASVKRELDNPLLIKDVVPSYKPPSIGTLW